MRDLAKSMLVSLLSLAAATVLAGCGDSVASVDDLATLDGEGFTVQMPGTPDRTAKSITDKAGRPVEHIEYVVDKGSRPERTRYLVAYTWLPGGEKGDLDGAVSGGANFGVGGQVASREKVTHQGFAGRDARITGIKDPDGDEITVFIRVIIAKDRLWQLSFIREGKGLTSPGAVYPIMRDSLKIE